MIKKYRHIFFDLDNTLWDFEKNSKNAMQITFTHFFDDAELPFVHFFETYSRINDYLWDEYKKRNIQKKELIFLRFKQTFSTHKLSGVEPEEMNAFYLEEMAKQKDLKVGAQEILQYLKKRNYILHIITNGFKEVQYKKLETSGLKLFFKNIFISEDVKVPKPGFEIFEYAIKSSNARKSECLMVGDDWHVDIVGANQFGIDSIYIPLNKHAEYGRSNGEVKNKNKIYIVDEIIDLKGFL
ncbi:noncanonical pyrimidine nucleotidase, YjjG family [Maribellus comscasis]|uniref:Noncanonical pyrimidine nucleotidase, YjjG family n=1 Tax=Maribellus comscasis TaxID=2681766 RepID=A0A6I6JQA4_9BACT|nr:YjjG family noncanonical pyrimidine nucleotidase [Maribellus comscasis]QGY45156.1 noncanonical pyrimidine nucleotidase, YjjG family [Maribellus comscasis]